MRNEGNEEIQITFIILVVTSTSTRDSDTENNMQSKIKPCNAETSQDIDTSTKIYPEIYPETRSTTPLDITGLEEEDSSQQTSKDAEIDKKTETSEIQKPSTSRSSQSQAQDISTPTSDPDTEINKHRR